MAKDDSDANELSSETIGYLEEVKKGKARKFAMICKGTSVISLVVYKKGNVEKRKKEAKEQGRGQFYFGIVDGKGMDIRFVLAREDGFESPPVKSVVLKGFLEEKADLKFKPYFEIVDAAPLALNDEDPLVARFLQLQDAALRACDAFPDRAPEINQLCLKIGKGLDQELNEQAAVDLDALEKLLSSLLASNPSSTSSQSSQESTPIPGDENGRIAKLTAALEKLRPLLDKVGQAQPNLNDELNATYASAQRDLQNQALDQAQAGIVGLGKRLKELLASSSGPVEGTPTSNAGAQESQDFARRQQQLEPRLLMAQKASQEKSLALGNVWQHALAQAANGNFAVANKAFDKLEQAIDGILNANQNKWAQWQSVREEVVQQIRQVATAVAATKDPAARQVIIELQAIIKNISPKPEGSQAISELRGFLNDDLITAAEEVPPQFGALRIRQPLLQALQSLEASSQA